MPSHDVGERIIDTDSYVIGILFEQEANLMPHAPERRYHASKVLFDSTDQTPMAIRDQKSHVLHRCALIAARRGLETHATGH